MKTRHLIRKAVIALSLATLGHQFPARAQGSLTPPGTPAPTMKSLDQIEARTPIDAAHTPGDGTNQFIISAPGSYYLTGNLTGVSNKYGISIKADSVSVDLNGFALIGVTGSLSGIYVPAAQRNLRVHNGSVQGWSGSGIDCFQASNSQFDHLRVSQNAGVGLGCGNENALNACSAETNNAGIFVGMQNTLTACNAIHNIGQGVYAFNNCSLTSCTASGNGTVGFYLLDGTTMTACTAAKNINIGIQNLGASTIRDCTANYNGAGISADSASVIVNCTACYNSGDGISCINDCFITGNTANYNSKGIHTVGSLNRIDGNTANHNSQYGIAWNNDIMIRNSAFANTNANYSPAAGTGNSGPLSVSSTSTSPWANF